MGKITGLCAETVLCKSLINQMKETVFGESMPNDGAHRLRVLPVC